MSPVPENMDQHKKDPPSEGGAGGLRKKLLSSYLVLAGIALLVLFLVLVFLFSSKKASRRFARETGPAGQASSRIFIGVQHSFSALRNWMLVPDQRYRRELATLWRDEISPGIPALQDLNAHQPDVIKKEIQDLSTALNDLEFLQWKIADATYMPGNEPARYLLEQYANPLEDKIFSEITSMIHIERFRQGGVERKILMGHMADFRAFFEKAHAALTRFVSNGRPGDRQRIHQYLEIVGKRLGQIRRLQDWMDLSELMDSESLALLGWIGNDLASYRDITGRIIEARASAKANLALYWLNRDGIPLAENIDRRLMALTDRSFARMTKEANSIHQKESILLVFTLFSAIALGVSAVFLSNRAATGMVQPLAALSEKAKGLSQGESWEMIPPGEADEIGDLIVSFNRMQRKLEEERQKIEQQKKHLEMVIESSPNGMLLMSEDGRIRQVNAMIERIFGYKRSELMGQPIEILLPERFRNHHVAHVAGFLKKPKRRWMGQGVPGAKFLAGLRKDGSQVPLDIGLGHIRSEKGMFVVAVFTDITERLAAAEKLEAEQKALERSNLELDSFVYTASHDLRAPLRGINSFSKFIEEDYADRLDDEGKDYLRRIRGGVNRMTRLIDDLLSLSRISRQKNPFEEVKVAEMISAVRERIEFDIEESGVDLVIQETLPVLYCDRIKMSEVFLNLINNAIKFSHKKKKIIPKIEIGYKAIDDLHQFFVKDNGIGIDPKYHEKIFDIFQRLHKREEYEGTGAGLSIVKRVIDDHKGRLWIDSEVGKGATFNFTIPKNLQKGGTSD